ncbi:MAG: hypothetical protein K2N87_09590 [Eubacterium sp.]|nr:hypothetical protein [Eubacterium sp.]
MKKKMAAFALIFAVAASSTGILASAAASDMHTLKKESFEIMSKEEEARIKDERIEEPVAVSDEKEDFSVNIEDLASDTVDESKITTFPIESMERATIHIDDWNISPGKSATSREDYSLEAGETVTINCSYTPFDASVDFGLITPSGNFRHANRTNGSIFKEIKIYSRGIYRLAIRNNSSRTVSVSGYVNY